MKDNSWQNFLNKGNQGGPKGKGGKQAGTASTKGNKAAGTRARKNALNICKLMKDFRKASVEAAK